MLYKKCECQFAASYSVSTGLYVWEKRTTGVTIAILAAAARCWSMVIGHTVTLFLETNTVSTFYYYYAN